MADFMMDLAWLEGISGRLGEAVSMTDTTLAALKETGPQRTGHKDLDKACLEFHDKWDERIHGFAEGVGDMSRTVAEAKASYGATEEAVKGSFGSLSGIPSVPGSPAVPAAPANPSEPTASTSAATPTAPAKSRITEVLG